MNGDRRQEGVRKVTIDDGNGGREVKWTIHKQFTPWHVLVGAVVAIVGLVVTIGTVAFNATRVGVAVQIEEELRQETKQDGGIVHDAIEHEITVHARESERELDRTLREIHDGIVRIETKQQTICERLERLEE